MLCVIRRLFTSLNVVLYTTTCQKLFPFQRGYVILDRAAFSKNTWWRESFASAKQLWQLENAVKGWNELKMQENISRLASQCRRSHALLWCVSPPSACTAVHYNKGMSKLVVLFSGLFSDHPEELRGCIEAMFHSLLRNIFIDSLLILFLLFHFLK